MNLDEYLAQPSGPASAATPQLSGPAPSEAGGIGLFESFSRRLGMAREGNYDDAFNFDKTPAAPPPGSETPWWMGGAVTDTAVKVAGLGGGAANALYRKSKGLPTSATQFGIQDIGTLKPAGVVQGMGGGMVPEAVDPAMIQKQYQENQAHRAIYEQAIERYKMGDVQGAEQLLEQYRQMGGVEGAVGAEAASLMGDPLMMMSLPSKLGAVMAPAMIHGGYQAGKRYVQTGQEKGFGSQEAMMELPGALVAGGMGAVAGVHAPTHMKNARASYKAWKAGRTPEGKAAAQQASQLQQNELGEAVGDIQADMMPVPEDVQARLHTALQGATTLINRGLKKNILKQSPDGGEVYRHGDDMGIAEPTEAFEIDANDPMNIEGQQGFKTVPASGPSGPETAGFFPGETPREIKYEILTEAKIKELAANSKDPVKTEAALRKSTAITDEPRGIVYVGPKGIDRIMRAKDSNSAVENAVSVITHEGVHALEGGRKKPTKTFDPMTGENITGTERAKPTQGGHDMGGEFDSVADDLSGVVRGESLQRLLENDPTWRKAQGLIDADGKISENLHEPGKDVISGTYRDSTGRLIESATGRGLGVGGKKLAKNELVSEANAKRLREAGKTSPDDLKSAGLNDLADEARALAEKVKSVPKGERPTAIKRILDEYVRVKHISPEHRSRLLQLTRTEIQSPTPNPAAGQADAMIAEAKRLAEQSKVAPAANQAEVDAAAERDLERIAPPPVAKNAPEGTTLRKRTTSEQQTADRETLLDTGNRWAPKSTEARLDLLRRAVSMGLGRPETYEAIGGTKQEFGRFMNRILNNKTTRPGALKILNPDAKGNVSTQGNVSTREISLNPRVVREAMTAEAEGRDFDASRLPKSSQGNLTPSQVSSTIQDTVRPFAAEAERRLKVKNPRAMIEYAKEIEAMLPNLRSFLHRVGSSLGSSRAKDLYNRDKQLEKLVARLRATAADINAADTRAQLKIQEGEKKSRIQQELDNLKQKEADRLARQRERLAAKRKAAAENAPGAGAEKATAALAETLKSEPPPGFVPKPSKKPAPTGGAEKTITPDMFADPDNLKSAGRFADEEPKKRLTAEEALGASRIASKEVRERAVKTVAEQNELKRQQEIVDRRSIAKRDETIGGRTGHTNVKKGEVKRGRDTIFKRMMDTIRGKVKVRTLTKHGAQQPGQIKVGGEGALVEGPGSVEYPATYRGGTQQTAEAPRKPRMVRRPGSAEAAAPFSEKAGETFEGISRGAAARTGIRPRPQAVSVQETKRLVRKSPTTTVSEETLDMGRGKAPDKDTLLRIRKEKEAREAQEKLDMSTIVESALGAGKEGKATTGWRKFLGQKESGAPKLTDPQGKPINREGFRKPVRKAFIRRMVADANRADRTSVLARSYEIIAKHAKALAMLEVGEQDAYIDKILRDKQSTQLQRTHVAQLRGKEPHQLANLYEDATAAAQALRGTHAQATAPKSIEQTNKERKDFVAKAIKDKMEMYNLLEDQIGANGRLRTGTEETTSRKKYKGGFRNLVEDFLDGREIDVDDEYYVHPKDRADMKRKLEAQAVAEFNEELSYATEGTADVIGIRPSLESKMNKARPLPPQLVPRGGKARGVDVKGNVEPTTFGEADKWLAENEAGEMEKRTVKAEKRATPADYESYPGFEGDRQTTPWREAGEVPLPVGKTGQKGTPASLIRRKGQPPSTEIRSNMDKLIASKEKFTISEADRAIMEILDREAETWVREQASAPPRIGQGTRAVEAPLPQGMNLKETKVKVRDMIKELAPKGASGWTEFNRRLLGEGRPRDRVTGELTSREGEGLITTLIRKKQLQGGEASVAFREAARKAFKEAQARMETDKERAVRVLGGKSERLAPPPGKTNPEDFKSAGAENMYKAAGDEVRKGIPLSENHKLAGDFARGMEQVSGGLKSGITGFDVSNPFRQTALLTSRQIATDPKGFARNVKEMVQSYSEERYTALDAKLRARPSYKNAVEAGLRLSMDPKDHDNFRSSDKLGGWISSWKKAAANPVNKLAANVVEKGILGAQRAYTHYQNTVMLDAFDAGEKWLKDRTTFVAKKGNKGAPATEIPVSRDEVADYIKKGYDVRKKQGHTKQGVKELVDLINTFASRSEVKNETLARVGNVALFSPQMIKSRLKTFANAGGWMYETPSVRSFGHGAVTSAVGLGAALTVLAYQGAKVAGYNPEVEMDPRSNDFGKLRMGHTTMNPWGDYQQYIRMGAQLLSGQQKLRGSGRIQQADRATIISRWLRGKLSPLASVATTIFTGADGAGREARSLKGKGRAIAEAVTPIMGSDMVDILSENPNALGGAMLALAAIGVGVSSSTATRSWIGDYASSQQDVRVTDEIRRLKLEPPRISSRVSLKGKNAVGQKLYYSLKGDEREEFVNEVMPLISKDIDEFIKSKRYQEAPDAVKRRLLFNTIKRENRRYSAAKRLKKQYEGATPVNQWWEED